MDTVRYDTPQRGDSWIEREPQAGEYARLRVKDNGQGIETKTLGQIFDPFFTTKFTGRGLGLASTLGIVRGHEGYLSVHSTLGQGSEFTILFPTVAAPQLTAISVSPTTSVETGGQTILVVDDEPTVLSITGKMLRSLGMRTIEAASGREAVDLFSSRRSEIDMVLLDWMMPGMDGIETLDELRSIHPDIPVVMCSGYTDEVISDRIAALSRVTFLQKPFRRTSILEALDLVLSLSVRAK